MLFKQEYTKFFLILGGVIYFAMGVIFFATGDIFFATGVIFFSHGIIFLHTSVIKTEYIKYCHFVYEFWSQMYIKSYDAYWNTNMILAIKKTLLYKANILLWYLDVAIIKKTWLKPKWTYNKIKFKKVTLCKVEPVMTSFLNTDNTKMPPLKRKERWKRKTE